MQLSRPRPRRRGRGPRSRVQSHKIWRRSASKPRSGLEDVDDNHKQSYTVTNTGDQKQYFESCNRGEIVNIYTTYFTKHVVAENNKLNKTSRVQPPNGGRNEANSW